MADARTDLQGRTVIYTDVREITPQNIVEVLGAVKGTYEKNAKDIEYLYDYYKGKQPVLERKKKYRTDINHKVVENRANEIVSFKVGYLMGEPVQYINQGDDEFTEVVQTLNDYMKYEDKEAKDKSLVLWNTICGTAYRMIVADETLQNAIPDEAPFEIYTLDPRKTFVVYYSGLGNPCVLGAVELKTQEGDKKFIGYTENAYFEVIGDKVDVWQAHALGAVPIIEYPANEARLGAFEIVLPLLDGLNDIESNRLDSIAQIVDAILVLKGADASDEDLELAKAYGGLRIPKEGDAFYLSTEINQQETQSLVNHIYESILTICGMPNRNTSSAGDNGIAVIYRDGYVMAEARAKDSELMFKSSEREMLKFALRFTNNANQTAPDLRISHIEIRFTRRNYENIQEKSQVLTTMLNQDKIHPKLAFAHSGMFPDPETAYKMSEEYYKNKIDEDAETLEAYANEEIRVEKGAINGEATEEI